MKCVITGNPEKGLGKAFADHFKSKGYKIVFIRSDDDDKKVAKKIQNCDVFVNNAFQDNDGQAKMLVALQPFVKKMIVVGSMASTWPDMKNFAYTQNKRTLQNVFYNKCSLVKEDGPHQVLFSITGSAYQDTDLIMRTVDFWLENPEIMEFKFGDKSADK